MPVLTQVHPHKRDNVICCWPTVQIFSILLFNYHPIYKYWNCWRQSHQSLVWIQFNECDKCFKIASNWKHLWNWKEIISQSVLTSKSIFLTNFVPFLSRYVVLCILWCACCCLSHHRHELGTTCHLSFLLLNKRLQEQQIKKFFLVTFQILWWYHRLKKIRVCCSKPKLCLTKFRRI